MPVVQRTEPNPPKPRMAAWAFGEDLTARLSFYPPDLRQDRHEHDRAQVSLVLAGNFGDRTSRSEASVFSGTHIHRPAVAHHAVHYGRPAR